MEQDSNPVPFSNKACAVNHSASHLISGMQVPTETCSWRSDFGGQGLCQGSAVDTAGQITQSVSHRPLPLPYTGPGSSEKNKTKKQQTTTTTKQGSILHE